MPVVLGDFGRFDSLILQLMDRERGLFRRVGTYRGKGREDARLILAPNENPDEIPCEYVDGKYRISII